MLLREPGVAINENIDFNWDYIKRMWDSLDKNNDGILDEDEIKKALELGILSKKALKTIDLNNDGQVDLNEVKFAVETARDAGKVTSKSDKDPKNNGKPI